MKRIRLINATGDVDVKLTVDTIGDETYDNFTVMQVEDLTDNNIAAGIIYDQQQYSYVELIDFADRYGLWVEMKEIDDSNPKYIHVPVIEAQGLNSSVSITDPVSEGKEPQSVSAIGVGQNEVPVSIDTSSLPDATIGSSYSQSIAVSGGSGNYEFVINDGSLPPTFSIDNSGNITGTPLLSDLIGFLVSETTYNFTVEVKDTDLNISTYKELSIKISR